MLCLLFVAGFLFLSACHLIHANMLACYDGALSWKFLNGPFKGQK